MFQDLFDKLLLYFEILIGYVKFSAHLIKNLVYNYILRLTLNV